MVYSSVPIKRFQELRYPTQLDLPNSVHAYQTAEKIRAQHPEPAYEWLVFVGFVHDLGKVMGVWGEPQVRMSLPPPNRFQGLLNDRETIHSLLKVSNSQRR